jgi:hypothetical protein
VECNHRLRNIIPPTTATNPNSTGSGIGVSTIVLTLSPGME